MVPELPKAWVSPWPAERGRVSSNIWATKARINSSCFLVTLPLELKIR